MELLPSIVFGIFGLITVSGALYVLLSKNVLYAAIGLLISFLGVAGLFVFAGAEFMAASQIMIYVGGILVLLLFGIMLSSNKKLGIKHLEVQNAPFGLMVSLILGIAAVLILLSGKLVFIGNLNPKYLGIKTLGFSLMSTHVLIIEIIGMLLLMALVGATFISKEDE